MAVFHGLILMNNMTSPFNNEIEIGIRLLILLSGFYPDSMDVEQLNYYDYFSLHTSDIGGPKSLHPPIPNRFGELSIKRELIQRSLDFLIIKGLVEQKYTEKGIEYSANETTMPFITLLSEEYTLKYSEKVKWVFKNFENIEFNKIKEMVRDNSCKWGSEILFQTLG